MRREDHVLVGVVEFQSRVILEDRRKLDTQREPVGQVAVGNPVALLELLQYPLQAGGARLYLGQVNAADVEHHGADIAVVLLGQLFVTGGAQRGVGVRCIGHPLVEMGQDVFQVLRAVFGGFDRIVAEVFLDGARIVTLDHLLAAVAAFSSTHFSRVLASSLASLALMGL